MVGIKSWKHNFPEEKAKKGQHLQAPQLAAEEAPRPPHAAA